MISRSLSFLPSPSPLPILPFVFDIVPQTLSQAILEHTVQPKVASNSWHSPRLANKMLELQKSGTMSALRCEPFIGALKTTSGHDLKK